MSMYNFIEYSGNYQKHFQGLWKYYRDDPVFNKNGAIIGFSVDDKNSNLNKKQQAKQEMMEERC